MAKVKYLGNRQTIKILFENILQMVDECLPFVVQQKIIKLINKIDVK